MVSAVHDTRIYEQMSRNFAQSGNDASVINAARDNLFLNHTLSGPGKIAGARIGKLHVVSENI